jgi:uncharacterized protein (TIGR03067 family)
MKTKTMKLLQRGSLIVVFVLAAAGCNPSKQTMEGRWTGFEVQRPEYKCTLTITGDQMEFHGADTNDWCRGSIVQRDYKNPKQLDFMVQEPMAVSNKTVLTIYIQKGKKLTVAAGHMGSDQRPTDFTPGKQVDIFKFVHE